jgi:leucyl/phenylalanyl-tRNA--protein transferase
MIFQLSPGVIQFPDPALADDDGLLATGGDLSEERLKLAYSNGIFPWYSEGEPILWYSPHERCVIFPGKIKVKVWNRYSKETCSPLLLIVILNL